MSYSMLIEAMRAQTRDSDAKLLLIAMADAADDRGRCAPASTSLARVTQQDPTTMLHALDCLKADGFVVPEGNTTEGRSIWRLYL